MLGSYSNIVIHCYLFRFLSLIYYQSEESELSYFRERFFGETFLASPLALISGDFLDFLRSFSSEADFERRDFLRAGERERLFDSESLR